MLELDGTVLESLPNAMFRVQLMDSEQARMRARTGTVARTHAPTHAAWRSGWHALRTHARTHARLAHLSWVVFTLHYTHSRLAMR